MEDTSYSDNEIENTYLYIADMTFISKYCVNNSKKYKTNKQEYIPIINTCSKNINELANSNFLIYLKCVKLNKSTKAGYFGYFIGCHILINEKIAKQQKDTVLNKNIKIDNLLFRTMVQNYSLCEVKNLVFIKYDDIIPFNNIVIPSKFKEICKKNNHQFEKFSTKLNCLNIVNYKINKPIEWITQYFGEDKEDGEDEEDDENEDDEDEEEDDEKEDEEPDMVIMNVPILWNPCSVIIEKMEKLCISKKCIKEHYNECETCEVVDNNRRMLEFNKKLNIHKLENDENKIIVDKIIDFYQLAIKYIDTNENFENNGLKEDEINIIYYKYEGELYDKSFLIIHK